MEVGIEPIAETNDGAADQGENLFGRSPQRGKCVFADKFAGNVLFGPERGQGAEEKQSE